ncbi:hypothetical protein Droror1_Dr00006536 [Drosera rotundifolia]
MYLLIYLYIPSISCPFLPYTLSPTPHYHQMSTNITNISPFLSSSLIFSSYHHKDQTDQCSLRALISSRICSMGRSPCCDKVGLKKGPWTPEEDQKLLAHIEEHGHGNWRALPANAGLERCGKSCRLRWTNYLRPDIKRGKFSLQEEQTIIQLHALLGNRWSAIATHLPKRTDNEIKNYWNTHLKKRLLKMGIDPVTHKPKSHTLLSNDGSHTKSAANLSHIAQWETARLEAEARLARQSKLRSNTSSHSVSPSTPTALLSSQGDDQWENYVPFGSGLNEFDINMDGFTELLLNNVSCGGSGGGGYGGRGGSSGDGGCSGDENDKSYWNNVLDQVNSCSSNSASF